MFCLEMVGCGDFRYPTVPAPWAQRRSVYPNSPTPFPTLLGLGERCRVMGTIRLARSKVLGSMGYLSGRYGRALPEASNVTRPIFRVRLGVWYGRPQVWQRKRPESPNRKFIVARASLPGVSMSFYQCSFAPSTNANQIP